MKNPAGQNIILFNAIVLSLTIWVSGCTGLGKISDGDYLVKEYQIQLGEKENIAHYKKVKLALEEEISKAPNNTLLWMRPGVALHNTIGEPKKKKGFRNWLKNVVGSPPVLLDQQYCESLNETFRNRLYHQGYFNALSTYEIDKKGKTASVIYNIEAGKVYSIDTLIMPEKKDTLSGFLWTLNVESLIKKGAPYNLDILKNERTRIDRELKDRGYFYFKPDYIKFLADTTGEDHKVKLKLAIKDEISAESKMIFLIDSIVVVEDNRLKNYHPDTIRSGDYYIVTESNFMKPKYFLNSIFYQDGSNYSRTSHNNSLKQLTGLQSYRFVNILYAPSLQWDDRLNVSYIMTPATKMSVSAELNAVNKSNNFAGPGVKLSYTSKNFFRGGELFSVNFNGRFEKQVGNEVDDTAYEISMDANLSFPRIIPFGLRPRNKPYLPKSDITLGIGRFSRVSLYGFNTFVTSLNYYWKKNDFITHQLSPADISITNLTETTQAFEEFLQQNPSIRQSFDEQFIIGGVYSFTINKLPPEYPRRYFLNIGLDESGNIIYLLSRLSKSNREDDEPVSILGNKVSQFSRIRTDFRYYFKTGKESILATRLFAAAGIPYANSDVMPYVKQFYAGGTNSMRAFRARSLGPGSYVPPDSLQNVLVDQTGEIKLEANLEYRFPIAGFLKGALFSDIGNIWLVNEDSLRPGGKFDFSTFPEQIAVGMGLGLRIDLNLLVLRFDWAFPLRKPWLPQGDRWAFNEINIFDPKWRRDNLLWNISIGYPF